MRNSAFILTLFVASLATAQERVIPRNFTWPAQPTSAGTYTISNDANFVNIARVLVHEGTETDAEDAANALATLIETDITNGHLARDGSNLVILLQGWGHDSDTLEPLTRFYQTSDALTLSGAWPETDAGLAHTRRAYSHPWLLNGTGTNPPLLAWTQTFVDTYLDRMDDSGATLPAPSRWYMDCEEYVALPVNRNGVYFLEQVASSGTWDDPLPGFPLPGETDDTAQELYATVATTYGWESDIHDQITSTLPAQDEQNQAVMAWWIMVTQRSIDATIKRCFYDIVHAAFEDCKVGNYGDSRMEGVNDTTGWFMDRVCPDDTCDSRQAGNELPRGWIERQWVRHRVLDRARFFRRGDERAVGGVPVVVVRRRGQPLLVPDQLPAVYG